jgi:hypothetical protein
MSHHKHETTQISGDGLRYSSKKNGSPFEGTGRTGEMMSCIKCGTHKPRSTGSFRRFMNANHFFCGDCRVVPSAANGAAAAGVTA